ncbi:MAG: hypothetical protein OXI87_19590 [Albidovulum sp.]|nr:hypothetical protein [Albidovulum sp.]
MNIMIRRSLLQHAAAAAIAKTPALARDTVKFGAIAPEAGSLAGGAVVMR